MGVGWEVLWTGVWEEGVWIGLPWEDLETGAWEEGH